YEVGVWGSCLITLTPQNPITRSAELTAEAQSPITPKPYHPKTLSPQNPITLSPVSCLLSPVSCLLTPEVKLETIDQKN
ncbi:hypothetical protein IQ234_17505, partial [Microcystis aeruginosa LEGE 91341]|nr:hypothetical protein [Microcystis aeruginosa LEGE 91341]